MVLGLADIYFVFVRDVGLVEGNGIVMKKRLISFFIAFMMVLCFSYVSEDTALNAAAAKKVSINKTNVTLKKGKSITLKLKGTKKKVTWSSNKKRIASVSKKGKVTARKVGKARITAKVGRKKYYCMVTVVKKKQPVTTSAKATTQGRPDNPSGTTAQGKPGNSSEVTTQGQPGTPSDATIKADAGEYSIANVHTGEGTYYDRESTGAANLDDYESMYFTAAMNHEDYMNGLAGAYVEITDKDGDKLNVLITDRLPEGKKGDIDLTRAAFSQIEPLVTGRMNISWRIVPLPTEAPISYLFKPTSTEYWAEVQVRNGRYPIRSVEYYNAATGQYVALQRQEYNYYKAPSGMGQGPYTFRVTDFYGHVLVDSGIRINTTSTPVAGAANFPY